MLRSLPYLIADRPEYTLCTKVVGLFDTETLGVSIRTTTKCRYHNRFVTAFVNNADPRANRMDRSSLCNRHSDQFAARRYDKSASRTTCLLFLIVITRVGYNPKLHLSATSLGSAVVITHYECTDNSHGSDQGVLGQPTTSLSLYLEDSHSVRTGTCLLNKCYSVLHHDDDICFEG